MLRWLTLRQAIYLWLILLVFFFGSAHAKRLTWAHAKADYLAGQIKPAAISPKSSGNNHYRHYELIKARYLLEFRDLQHPELERTILFCEGRRFHNRYYLYRPIYLEWPSHRLLIDRCLKHSPDDAEILKVAGKLKMMAGEIDEAALVLASCLADEEYLGERESQYYIDALILMGQDDRAQAYLTTPDESGYISVTATLDYMAYLNQGERYHETIQLAARNEELLVTQSDYWKRLGEARVYSGQIQEYKAQIWDEVLGQFSPDRRKGHAHSTRFWKCYTPRSAGFSFQKEFNLSTEIAKPYWHDPHLVIMDGRYDIAEYFYGRNQGYWERRGSMQWADAFCANGDPGILSFLEEKHAKLCQKFIAEHGTINWLSKHPDSLQPKDSLTHELQRCYVADCDWEQAELMEGMFSAGDIQWLAPGRQESRLLCALARGEGVASLNLRRLFGSGKLAAIVRTQRFTAALEAGGIPREQALAEIRIAAKPWWKEHEN